MSTLYTQRETLDVLEVDGEAILLLPPDQVVRLSALATTIFNQAASATTLNVLATAAENMFGPPPVGTTKDSLREILASLVAAGVLECERDD